MELWNVMSEFGSSFLDAEVTRMTIAFVIAARLHRKWVKKDVAEQIFGITDAINNLGGSLHGSITNQSKRIDVLSGRVDNLERKQGGNT